MDINSYFKDGKVRRSKIALDIKNGDLTKQDVEELISNERISASFFGNGYIPSKTSDLWDRSYLDIISNAASAEAFNAEYLRYLYEVAEHVNKKETVPSKGSKALVFIIIGAIIVVTSIILLVINGNNGSVH